MDTSRWKIVKDILDQALNMDEDRQTSFVRDRCKGDEDLEEEVLSLLKSIQSSEKEDFLENSFAKNSNLINDAVNEHIADGFIGKRIGSFKITERIGVGGMSAVFKAERADEDFHQEVAIKLIRSGLHSEQILQRFELEKQILADLTHPNIARLYDGGITDAGNPYLMMEFIDGKPIHQYCNDHQLTVDERLELFQEVCSAVEYAHNNLIVHRDIKAQNIFVTEEEVVKVLDFGIAKLLDTDLAPDKLVETQPGQQLWTPHYASPEQINGEPVSTAVDVYSLGVLLHKLLTGQFPYSLKGKSSTEIVAVINETKPKTLNQSLKEADSVQQVAAQQRTTTGRLKKKLDSDLDAITQKALRKDTSDRYDSVSKLAEDLDSYKSNLPVRAKKGRSAYVVKKFAKRHQKSILAIIVVALTIVGITGYFIHQLKEKKRQAVIAKNKAEQVTQLLSTLFIQADPNLRTSPDITLKEVLHSGSKRIKNGLSHQPIVKAELLGLIGGIYNDMGLYHKAEENLKTAIKVLDDTKSKAAIFTHLSNISVLAYTRYRQGYFEKADSLQKIVLNLIESNFNRQSIRFLNEFNNMALLYQAQGKYDKAIGIYKEILSMDKIDSYRVAKSMIMNNLGLAYQNMGEFEKSIQALKVSLTLKKQQHENASAEVANTIHNLAFTYQRAGNLQKADSLYRIALPMMRQTLPPKHPYLGSCLVKYGLVKVYQGKLQEAEKMFMEGYHILKSILPEGHWQIQSAAGGLALVHGLKGQLARAIPKLNKIYNQWLQKFGKSDWRTKEAHKALQTLLITKRNRINRLKSEPSEIFH